MKRYIVAAVLIVGFTTPGPSRRLLCHARQHNPQMLDCQNASYRYEKFSMMGQYGSEAEAMSAMHKMAKCKG